MNMPHHTALVLAADGAIARLFVANDAEGEMEEIGDLTNPDAHADERDLVADASGRRGASSTEGGHSAYGGGSMKAHRIEDFAAEVCKQTAMRLTDTQAERFYVIAEPHFLGLLRQRMDKQMKDRVSGEIGKVLTRHTPAQIRAALPARL